MSEEYGPLVRLWGIHPSQLPPAGAKGEDLKPFLSAALNEALPFISNISGPSAWKQKLTKTFPHCAAPVKVYVRTVTAPQLAAVVEKHHPPGIDLRGLRGELWALRQSVHENAAEKGTASWGEFVRCFKEEHAEAEVAFTPGVLGTKVHRAWDCAGVTVEGVDGAAWTDMTLKSEESTHQLPGPLSKRLFPVVQVTAATVREGRREFIVVQIMARRGDGEEERRGVVRAAYSSIETVKETPEGKIEWVMGTASDAGGYLPTWVQKMAVPGEIAKDPDLFLRWIAEEREKGSSEIL